MAKPITGFKIKFTDFDPCLTAALACPIPAMRLYLIRHAHALDAEDDRVRPLSKRGHRQVRALAKFFGKSGEFTPVEIWHSPLVRSWETAEQLAARMKLDTPMKEVAGLEPEDDPRATARRIRPRGRDIAIVGHEPHLSALATQLVVGGARLPAFVLKKCAALALERDGAQWAVRWLVAPELIA